jgi:hypothetical protein
MLSWLKRQQNCKEEGTGRKREVKGDEVNQDQG